MSQSTKEELRRIFLKTLWWKVFNREPCKATSIKTAYTSHDVKTAIEELISDPLLPKVIAVDCEFYYDRSQPFRDWADTLKLFPISELGDNRQTGPFVRIIQIARVDGLVWIFDLFAIGEIPFKLRNLFSDRNVKIIGFNFGSDRASLLRTCLKFRRDITANVDGGDISSTLVNLNKAHAEHWPSVPFNLTSASLKDVVESMFLISFRKFEFRKHFWNRPLVYIKETVINSVANEAVAHFDVYLMYNRYYYVLRSFASEFKLYRRYNNMPLSSECLCKQLPEFFSSPTVDKNLTVTNANPRSITVSTSFIKGPSSNLNNYLKNLLIMQTVPADHRETHFPSSSASILLSDFDSTHLEAPPAHFVCISLSDFDNYLKPPKTITSHNAVNRKRSYGNESASFSSPKRRRVVVDDPVEVGRFVFPCRNFVSNAKRQRMAVRAKQAPKPSNFLPEYIKNYVDTAGTEFLTKFGRHGRNNPWLPTHTLFLN